ncbi:MAG: VPLPA-CTERM sorting domain-containing protein [Steroidobacteraceae bacterium]
MIMNSKSRSHIGVIAALIIGSMSTAQAETVTTELFHSTTLVTASSLNGTELSLAMPGTLTFKLEDLKWPGLLDTLSFVLTDNTSVLKTYKFDVGSTSGSWTYNVTSPQTLYAAVFAKPATTSQAGMYYANISYETAASPVPLPAALWLLISGLGGLIAFRPKLQLSQT